MYGIYENGGVIAKFVTPMSLLSNVPERVTDTLALGRSVMRRAAQRWELQTRLEPLSLDANELFANVVVAGHSQLITIVVPQNIGVLKKRTSVSSPTAVGAKGASAVTLSGNVGLIPRGTMIKFANHSKIYMATSSRDGNGALGIFPTLRVAVSNITIAHREDVIMNCYYDTDTVMGMAFEDGVLMDLGTVKLIEKI